MAQVYCDWRTLYGEAGGEVYSVEEARRRFEAGERCTVLIGDDPQRPETVMEIDLSGEMIKVTWLDELLRPELMYLFSTQEEPSWPEDQLLLEQTHIPVYENDNRPPEHQSSHDESFYFKADGSYWGVRASRGGADTEETRGTLDPDQLAIQTEPLPVFGEWDSLLRRER